MEYRKATDCLEEQANTGCIPWIIRLANNNNLVDQETAYFRQKDPSLPPCMHKLYGLYKAIVHEVNYVWTMQVRHLSSSSIRILRKRLYKISINYIAKIYFYKSNKKKIILQTDN